MDATGTVVGAHAQWKSRLREAILHGTCDLLDAECEWSAAVDTSIEDPQCRILHGQLHAAAAEVLELAMAGKRDAALEQMAPGTQFAMSLRALERALR